MQNGSLLNFNATLYTQFEEPATSESNC